MYKKLINCLKANWKLPFQKKSRPTIMIPADDLQLIRQSLAEALLLKQTAALTSAAEKKLIERIRMQTAVHNRNNVTRTAAYWRLFAANSELHWALLAHMVSRNGGWCMTDLQGEFLPHVLKENERKYFFQFFERANALIFQDAYPQLLLYEESKKQQQNLFHLLPAFHISRFMEPFWNQFWEQKNASLLTIALIVNEQNYIEKRVVQQPFFQKHVLQTWKYQGQDLLQLAQVVFPYGRTPSRLAGVVVKDFTDLEERMEVGKQLYGILFGISAVHQGALTFARNTPHTGSRADYWPSLFTKQEPAAYTKQKLTGCKLHKNAPPLYSPELVTAWADQSVAPPERFDWFHNLSQLNPIQSFTIPANFELTTDYCAALNKLELAVMAKTALNK